MSSTGQLELIIGPMFSGKSTELMRKLNIDRILGFKVVYINHSLDTRGNGFSTHNPSYSNFPEDIFQISTDTLPAVEDLQAFDTIGIDEAQFFGKQVLNLIERYIKSGKHIIMAGLIADSSMKQFGNLIDLMTISDNILHMKALCFECSKKRVSCGAPFTFRLGMDQNQINIGGLNQYIPLCRKHYEEHI